MTVVTGEGPATSELPLGEFVTADGQVLRGLRLRYSVLGDTEAARDHGWILVFHALTGSADVEAWWGPLIGPGKALDTSRHAILAANLLGSCYGSTGPREWASEHDEPFPELSPADLALAHAPLLAQLGVDRLSLVTGGSLGGMCPNSSLSISSDGIAAQLTSTNAWSPRGDTSCRARATSSLPVPFSPVISTRAEVGPTLAMSPRTVLSAGLDPTI